MQAFLLFELVRVLCEIQYFNFVFTNAIEQYRIVLESGKWKHQIFLHPQRNYVQTQLNHSCPLNDNYNNATMLLNVNLHHHT